MPHPARPTSPANVGNGAVSAADVLERHLAAIDAGDAEIHAFNVVTVDVAREQAAAVDAGVAAGRDMGRLAGVPVALKDNMCTQGIADHLFVEDPRGLEAARTTRRSSVGCARPAPC